VRTADAIIVGGGIIGLSLAIALRKRGAKVLLIERGEPGREASHAAAGMLDDDPAELPAPLHSIAAASACMYPEFVHELQDESGLNVDLRDCGTLIFPEHHRPESPELAPESLLRAPLSTLEPTLAGRHELVLYRKERSVDPRALAKAALKAARHREVEVASGTLVQAVRISNGRVDGVDTDKTTYLAPVVINCAGAWAGHLPPHSFPTRPVKGQMLSLVGGPSLRHVIRSPEVYLVPRSDGRILIGASVEEAGYDKRIDPDTIQRLHHAAVELVPSLMQGRMLEAWAGLRPGTPDNLPLLGATATPGYFVAAGHFRDGILLAPITAHVMAQLVSGEKVDYDLARFSPQRFPD
jgi:glycine oxidase